jgi:hypothetical protein
MRETGHPSPDIIIDIIQIIRSARRGPEPSRTARAHVQIRPFDRIKSVGRLSATGSVKYVQIQTATRRYGDGISLSETFMCYFIIVQRFLNPSSRT